jgi:sulfite reductase (NADPH) flavoprotein alpha-component
MSLSLVSPKNPSLDPEHLAALEAFAEPLSPAQTLLAAQWLLSRFDAAALAEERFEFAATATAGAAPAGLTVLYGSHSGHSAAIAKALMRKAHERGWAVTLANMAEYARGNLKREKNLAVVVSTHGEGQPPESIAPFFDYLLGKRAPKLNDSAFAVLALGDRSYVHFCRAGLDVDVRLEQLGAKRMLGRVDLDVDYQEGADAWIDKALEAFAPRMVAGPALVRNATSTRRRQYDRENPWMAELLERTVLSGRSSTQHFVHLELSLEGSGIKYEPGDALGLRPENDPALVAQLLEALGSAAETPVMLAGEACALADALTRRLEIRLLSPSSLRKYAGLGARGLADVAAAPERIAAYLDGRDWVDVLREHPLGIDAQSFVTLLPELTSRSYSIASCQAKHPDEVHLLVSRVDYPAHGRVRQGVASSYLAHRVQPGDKIAVWVEPNSSFRLPIDPDTPIVLVGAGTGIAPYRAFLQARDASGAKGKNWVIFGNRNFRSDFTYQTEWLAWRNHGLLARMDTAFSRDTTRKVYVTDRLLGAGPELCAWLEQGARIYLCGDRAKLSSSVDRALVDVMVEFGGKSTDQASEYIAQLRTEGRYVKDVY